MANPVTFLTARPTYYRGVLMRSRLEADFAAWLDGPGGQGLLGGAPWSYESACFADENGQYLPDFVCREHPDGPLFIELKPAVLLTLPEHDHLAVLDAMRPIFASVPLATTAVVYRERGDDVLRDMFFTSAEALPRAWHLVGDPACGTPPLVERVR